MRARIKEEGEEEEEGEEGEDKEEDGGGGGMKSKENQAISRIHFIIFFFLIPLSFFLLFCVCVSLTPILSSSSPLKKAKQKVQLHKRFIFPFTETSG